MKPTQRYTWIAGVALLALTGCSTPAEPTAEEPPSTDGFAVEVMQYRPDEVNRVLVVKVGNTSEDGVVAVDGLEVVAPGFDGVGEVDVTANISPGRQFDLRIPYGEPVCAGDDPTGDVVVRLGVPDSGAVRKFVSPPGSDVLAKVREQECTVSDALAASPLRWSTEWRRIGAGDRVVVEGRLLVGPVARGQRLQIRGMDGSVLFTPLVDGLPLALAPGESRRVAVSVAPQRCDPHAMADGSKGFEFQVRVRLPDLPDAGQTDVLVPVVPDRAGKNMLAKAWLEKCGFAEDTP